MMKQNIFQIANKIEKAGGRLYLVGGALRDKFLQRENNDKDYCVTGITAQEFQDLFPKAHVQGKSFEVFNLEGKEFALARIETKIGKGHKEFEIKTGKDIKIEDDLARRDITINSIAQDVITEEIIDPFNGREDIKNKIIRATTEKFKEDPLRVYRVARFMAELEEFTVEDKTIEMMKSLKKELSSLSKERVFKEFEKALLTNKPSMFFETLRKANVLEVHFKPISKLIGALQPQAYHPEGDAYNHTMLVLDASVQYTKDPKIRFAVLVHDFGKGETPKEEYPHHNDHEIRGAHVVTQFSHDLGLPNSWKKCGQTACKEHMRGGKFNEMRPSKKVQFIERVDKSYLGLHGLQIVVNCDKGTRNRETPQFEKIGKKCLQQITGEIIRQKYGIETGILLGKKLHEERVKWMKEQLEQS